MEFNERSLRPKLGYGVADMYGGGAYLIISIFFIYFVTHVVGMSPALAGSIPLIGRAWDAITDPVMGAIVDRTRSKFGAKRFYLLLGSFIASLTFMLLWVSVGGSARIQYVYYLGAFLLFSTGSTIVMVPYDALLPDMVSDYHLRGQYTGIRMIFSAWSAILGAILPDLIIRRYEPARNGYLVMGIVFGVLFFVALILSFFNTYEPPRDPRKIPSRPGIRENLRVFKNRAFRMYLGIFLFGQGSADFIMALILFFLAYVLVRSEQYILIMAGVLSSQLMAMFIYQFLLKRFSKKLPIYIGLPIQVVAMFGFWIFSYEGAPMAPVVLVSFLLGFGTAAATVSSFAILADMADVDELITAKRRPGLYAGMATFSRKIANGFALGLVGMLLAWVGFDKSAETQTAFAVQGIRMMIVLLPLFFILAALAFTYFHPINERTFAILKKEIQKRRAGDRSPAPADEIATLEKITGYAYRDLWKPGSKGG